MVRMGYCVLSWSLVAVFWLFICVVPGLESVDGHGGYDERRRVRRGRGPMYLPDVWWNTSNAMFKASNNDHMIEVIKFDKFDIFCPFYTNEEESLNGEQYLIWQATEEEFTHCNLDPLVPDGDRLLLLNCSDPHNLKRYTVFVDLFSPTPNAPEFLPGKKFYIITMSTGTSEGLSNKISNVSACKRNNMKLIVNVLDTSSTSAASNASTTPVPPVMTESSTRPPLPPSSTTTATTTTSAPTTTTPTTTATTTNHRRHHSTRHSSRPTVSHPGKGGKPDKSGESSKDINKSNHENEVTGRQGQTGGVRTLSISGSVVILSVVLWTCLLTAHIHR